jgi:MFS superfamily sulfate permease-like transporter
MGHDGGRSSPRESIVQRVPGLNLIRPNQRQWSRREFVAGLVLTTLLVPQGMAYAELAGLPAVTGLYTTVVALLAYAALGPSRILVLGPDSALGPLIAAALLPLLGARGDPARAVALAGMLALLMGALLIGAGLARLGILAELLSKPVRIGFLNGIALVVFVSQLPQLFGFSTHASGLLGESEAFVRGVRDGKTVTAALLVGVASRGCSRVPPLVAESARHLGRRRGRSHRDQRVRPRRTRRLGRGVHPLGLPDAGTA